MLRYSSCIFGLELSFQMLHLLADDRIMTPGPAPAVNRKIKKRVAEVRPVNGMEGFTDIDISDDSDANVEPLLRVLQRSH